MKNYDLFRVIKKSDVTTPHVQKFQEELLVDIKSVSIRIKENGICGEDGAVTHGSLATVSPLKGKAIYLNGYYNWHLVKRDGCVYLVPTKREK